MLAQRFRPRALDELEQARSTRGRRFGIGVERGLDGGNGVEHVGIHAGHPCHPIQYWLEDCEALRRFHGRDLRIAGNLWQGVDVPTRSLTRMVKARSITHRTAQSPRRGRGCHDRTLGGCPKLTLLQMTERGAGTLDHVAADIDGPVYRTTQPVTVVLISQQPIADALSAFLGVVPHACQEAAILLDRCIAARHCGLACQLLVRRLAHGQQRSGDLVGIAQQPLLRTPRRGRELPDRLTVLGLGVQDGLSDLQLLVGLQHAFWLLQVCTGRQSPHGVHVGSEDRKEALVEPHAPAQAILHRSTRQSKQTADPGVGLFGVHEDMHASGIGDGDRLSDHGLQCRQCAYAV